MYFECACTLKFIVKALQDLGIIKVHSTMFSIQCAKVKSFICPVLVFLASWQYVMNTEVAIQLLQICHIRISVRCKLSQGCQNLIMINTMLIIALTHTSHYTYH